jgi:hypothetical protein
MKRFLVTLAAIASVFVLAACSGSDESFATSASSANDSAMSQSEGLSGFAMGAPGLPSAPAPSIAPSVDFSRPESFGSSDGKSAGEISLQLAERMVISTGSISVEVEVVQASVQGVQAISEGLGGFVEQLSSYGVDNHQRASITIRVPQAQFTTALERIRLLGDVQSENIGSDDVSEQFIDLEARLKSALREEESLLSLLGKAQNVSDILTIERELSRVRSDIERSQGQLNFLERRIDLSTIHIELFPPDEEGYQAPSLSENIAVGDVGGRLEAIKALVTGLNGELDRVSYSESNGVQRADLIIRVFTADFNTAVASIESDGEIVFKEIQEGAGEPPIAAPGDKPDAWISLALTEKDETSTIAIVITAILVLLGLGLIIGIPYGLYRYGRKRGIASKAV